MKKQISFCRFQTIEFVLALAFFIVTGGSANAFSVEIRSPGIQPPEIAAWTAADKSAARGKSALLYDELTLAIASGATNFVIPRDNYLINSPFIISGANGVHIDGNGATFWTQTTGVLNFSDCQNCTVENLILDKLTYPFVQGVVREIIPEDGGYERIIIDLEQGSWPPQTGSTIGRTLCRSATTGQYYSRPCGYGEYPGETPPVGEWHWMRYPWADNRAPSMQQGDRVAMHAFFDGGEAGLKVYNCGNMHFIDISVYGASGFQVMESGIRSPGNNRYTRLKIIPRPNSTRLAVGPKDGFHSYNQKVGPALIDCEIAATYDDGINIHGFMNVVLQKNASNEYVIASEFGRDYEVGTMLTFYEKPTMAELSQARVVGFVPFDPVVGEGLLADAVQYYDDIYNTPIRATGVSNEFFKVTLDRPVAAHEFDLAVSADYCGAGAHIKNLYMHDGCNRGVLIKSPDAVIENSRFENVFFGGIYAAGSLGPLEADFADNLTIRSNQFSNCAYNSIRVPGKVWSSFSPITVIASTGPKPVPAYLHIVPNRVFSNLTITGNTIEDSPGIAMFIGNAENATISSNTIIRPLQEEWLYPNLNLSNLVERTYAPAIDPAVDLDLQNPLYGIYVASGKNVVLQGNEMEAAPLGTKGLVGFGPWTSEIYTNMYDDFSSGDLSKWVFTHQAPQRTDPQVINQALVWGSSATAGWGVETLVSTQNDFDLIRSVANPLELSFKLATLTPKSNANSYDSFSFGWMDASGDILKVRYSYQADSAGNNAAIQFFYNGVVFGNTWWSGGYLYNSGDIVTMSMDDAGFTLYRDRSGVVVTVGTIAFNDPSFTGTGSIYFDANLQGDNGEIVLDNIH